MHQYEKGLPSSTFTPTYSASAAPPSIKRLKHTVIDDGCADIFCRPPIPALGSFAYFYAQVPAIKSLCDLLMIERSHRLISAF